MGLKDGFESIFGARQAGLVGNVKPFVFEEFSDKFCLLDTKRSETSVLEACKDMITVVSGLTVTEDKNSGHALIII